MKRAMMCLWLVGWLVWAAPGALTPGQKTAAEALIRQFGAAEFDARQKAVEAIVALGPDVAPLVKKALAETADNEVKLRCEMALKALREKFGAAALGEPAPAGPRYDASKVTLDVKDAPLAEALESLAQQSGNAPVNAGNFADRRVTLSLKDVPYWQAMDRAVEQAGLVCFPPWYRGGTTMVMEAKSAAPTLAAYPGPAAVWVDRVIRQTVTQSAARLRTDLTTPAPETQRVIHISLRAAVEDRLPVSGGSIRFLRALTPDGADVLPNPAPPPNTGHLSTLVIHDTDEGIRGPLTLDGILRVDCCVGKKERRVDDLFGGGRQTVGDEEGRLVNVTAWRRGATVRVTLTLEEPEAPASVVALTGDRARDYGFALVDPAGKRHATIAGWSRRQADLDIDFADIPDLPGKWSLLYAFPERVETREFPFTLKDVPLP